MREPVKKVRKSAGTAKKTPRSVKKKEGFWKRVLNKYDVFI